jgi:ABC-2 type transport system ATP-binding protein
MSFGRIRALEGITADIPAGCISGLVGPDAAGKSTLMRLLAGLMLPSAGELRVLGQEAARLAESAPNSIGYMPQRFGLYEDLSVEDNLRLHARLRALGGREQEALFERLLTFTSLKPFTTRLAGRLSGGMKQKLGIACALLGSPRLLLLDEPGVGVDPQSRRELWRMVEELADEGMTIIWSTAYLDEAERCPHVLMLDRGHLVYEGAPAAMSARVRGRVYVCTPPQGVRSGLEFWTGNKETCDALAQGSRLRLLMASELSDATRADLARQGAQLVEPRLEDAYMDMLGGMGHQPSPFAGERQGAAAISEDGPPAIRAVGLVKKFGEFTAADKVSFEVWPGRIFGLLGPNGAGKSTTFRMLCGLLRPTAGECFVAGVNLLNAGSTARARLGYMAQAFSLYPDISVSANIRIMADLYGLDSLVRKERTELLADALELGPFLGQKAGLLPLGHKRRLALACATLHSPPVLFLDEPTSGVDARTRREFWKHINAMTRTGVAVLVTTHFMEEAEYCDQIALIYRGSIITRGTPDELKAACPAREGVDPGLEDAFIACIEEHDRLHPL